MDAICTDQEITNQGKARLGSFLQNIHPLGN